VRAVQSISEPGHLCWVDLATTDVQRAAAFYGRLFGWSTEAQAAGGGRFNTFYGVDGPVGSMYQLSGAQVAAGVPAHWTMYISATDVDRTAETVTRLGGQVVVPAQSIAGVARIALIADPAGAIVGLWQSPVGRGGRR